jgi:DNA-binding Lrp family transcriptional regulator
MMNGIDNRCAFGRNSPCAPAGISAIKRRNDKYGAAGRQSEPMKPIFVQLQCAPGKTYEVADALYATELISELYSTSGEYDLLLKIYVESEEDIGKFINDHVAIIPGIVRTLTTLTFRAF